jgi:hypothetical protein
MKTLTKFAAIAAVTFSAATFAGGANASTILQFPFGGFSFHAPMFYTGDVAGPVNSSLDVTNAFSVFSFDPGIGGVGTGVGETANFTFHASTTDLATSSNGNLPGAILEQRGFGGSFTLTYLGLGLTPLPTCLSGPCTNLLSGTFTGGVLLGHQGSSHVEESDGTQLVFQTLTLSSDFYNFGGAATESFSVALDPTNPPLNFNPGTGLIDNFNGVGTGSAGFGIAVPEPGTWALMIMGFGGVGAMIRRRRQGLAFA